MDVSFSELDFNITTCRNFFGSRHGKGPCDAVGGVVKSLTRRAVIGKDFSVNTAQEMYDLASESFIKTDKHRPRNFELVKQGEVLRNRPERQATKPLAGTRKIHSIISTNKPGKIMKRNLSCFCESCLLYPSGRQEVTLCGIKSLKFNGSCSNSVN